MLALAAPGSSDAQTPGWRYYAADNGATRYSPLDQIDRSIVGRLAIAWRHPHVDPALFA